MKISRCQNDYVEYSSLQWYGNDHISGVFSPRRVFHWKDWVADVWRRDSVKVIGLGFLHRVLFFLFNFAGSFGILWGGINMLEYYLSKYLQKYILSDFATDSQKSLNFGILWEKKS